MVRLEFCDTSEIRAFIPEEMADLARSGSRAFRLELDGRPAGEVWPGGESGQAVVTFPIPARWYDGRRHVCRLFLGDARQPITEAGFDFPSLACGHTPRISCRLEGSLLALDAPPWMRTLDVRTVCGETATSHHIVRSWGDWGRLVPLCDVRDMVASRRPLPIVVRDAASGLALEGGVMVTGTSERPLLLGGLDPVDGPFVSGFAVRLPLDPGADRRVRLVRGDRTLAEAAPIRFRPDCQERWRAPWSGFQAVLPPALRAGLFLLVDGDTVLARKRFSRIDAALSGLYHGIVSGVSPGGAGDVASVADGLERLFSRHPAKVATKWRSLHEILKGILTVLAVGGDYDEAARRVVKKGLFPFLGCGDGRVMEGLRAVIDEASSGLLPAMLEVLETGDDVARRLMAPRLRLRLAAGNDAQARAVLGTVLDDPAAPMHLRLLAHETLDRYAG